MQKNKTIVSIFGGSGSGKSTLAKLLQEKYPELFSRVPTDYYLEAKDTKVGRTLGYNWQLLQQHLDSPLGTRIEVPGFDFNTWERIPPSGWKYEIRSHMLIDSMKPYPNSDYFIRIEVPNEIRRERIIERDKRNKTNVIKDWDWHNRILRSILQETADLVLDGNFSTEKLISQVTEFLNLKN